MEVGSLRASCGRHFFQGRCDVQLYAMDEGFVNVQSRGSPFSLMKWYQDGDPDIIAATFFCGSDELCLVEASGRVRVFSFLAQSFRYVLLQSPPKYPTDKIL